MVTTTLDDQELSALSSALAAPRRLQILRLLAMHQGQINVKDLETQLDYRIREATISYHLSVLQLADLVSQHRKGHEHFYAVCWNRLKALRPAFDVLIEGIDGLPAGYRLHSAPERHPDLWCQVCGRRHALPLLRCLAETRGALAVEDIQDRLGLTPTIASNGLIWLYNRGILGYQMKGHRHCYRINPARLIEIRNQLDGFLAMEERKA